MKFSVLVIISVTRKELLLRVALPSVLMQTKLPDNVYLVSDTEDDILVSEAKELSSGRVPMKFLLNQREKNVSGAMNTALSEILADGYDPHTTFVATLDDDDWWEKDYLEACYNAAIPDMDWVVPGIIRHESVSGEVKYLSIPDNLTEKAFLRGNPHVQGSNLFIRLSRILEAGGYDENLPSTTDRDICIRLLALGDVNFSPIRRHLVHHMAFGSGRLSEPGSQKKCEGLRRFYYKYSPLMDVEDKKSFLERAKDYFMCNIEAQTDVPTHPGIRLISTVPQGKAFDIVIGVIVSRVSNFESIVRDVVDLNDEIGCVSAVVVSDNVGLSQDIIDDARHKLDSSGIDLKILSAEEAQRSADRGELGNYYQQMDNRKGIAFGRTALQRYVYIQCVEYRNPVAWIVDDDISLRYIYWGTLERKISGTELLATINRWQEEGVSIAVGRIGGDPPVPIMSTLRTQMLDLYFYVSAFASGPSNQRSNSMKRLGGCDIPAYFYDFPEGSSRNLETPVWLDQNFCGDLRDVTQMAELMFTKDVFRPASYPVCGDGTGEKYYDMLSEEYGPVRGGNTIILDMSSLKDFSNSAPKSDDIAYRRGDTLWVILNKRLGPTKSVQEGRKVISSPLMLVQERRQEESFSDMRGKFVADVLGSGFVRAMDLFLLKKNRAAEAGGDYYSRVRFDASEVEKIISLMENEISKRVKQLNLNVWRIKGLTKSIRKLMVHWSDKSLESILRKVEELFDDGEMASVVAKIMNFNRTDVKDFLNSIALSNRQFSGKLPVRYNDNELPKVIEKIQKAFGTEELELVGQGWEGIVFTDNRYGYKYFHYGPSSLDEWEISAFKKLKATRFENISNLEDIYIDDNALILKREYVHGEHYRGGHLRDIVSFLVECKTAGIVLKNVAPKNFVITGHGLKFIDIGRDVEEFTEPGYERMCRRAYLMYRWHFREDLSDLFRMSNTKDNFPELFGFKYFRDLLDTKDTAEILRPFVMQELNGVRDLRVLDYGCGSGWIADELTGRNDVFVFDIDMTLFHEKHLSGSGPKVLSGEDLASIASEAQGFDLIILSLVLCTVPDREATEVLSSVRKVLRKGGQAIAVICNPFGLNDRETTTHEKLGELKDYSEHFSYQKRMKSTGRSRSEYHRPLEWYIHEMRKAGLLPTGFIESDGASFDTISPSSEFLIIRAVAVELPKAYDVSLMIKASAMEWRTIDFQVKHIVNQLEGPERFREKFVVTDVETDGFARQYDVANLPVFRQKLRKLVEDGVIDFVMYGSKDPESRKHVSERWFRLNAVDQRSVNGQPVLTTLSGFEVARSQYILQMDSDCIINRNFNKSSYIKELVDALERNPKAITASFPVLSLQDSPFTGGEMGRKWRTEVRNCIIDRTKLFSILPLPNFLTPDGKLKLPWHRSLDLAIASLPLESLRGSGGNACFIHVQNSLKHDFDFWYNAIIHYQDSAPKYEQSGQVDLVATDLSEVLDSRKEEMVVLMKGRNVPVSKLRRCLYSMLSQDFQGFGVIYIDAASWNGSYEYMRFVGSSLFQGRITLFRNYEPKKSAENIFTAMRKLSGNPESIIVMVDADDALIGADALSKVRERYRRGADITVGTMIRADKFKKYPVDLDSPRANRGGNVWQHLRTFKKYLFDAIAEDDLKIDGEWVEDADDWAYMIPMVEMAENPQLLEEIVYFYEPSPGKDTRSVARREDIIGKILAKVPYRRVRNG